MSSLRYNPAPSIFKECLISTPVPDKMMRGMRVVKIGSNGKAKAAYLTLSPDKFTVYITENKFKGGKVGLVPLRKPLLTRVTSIGSNHEDEFDYERALDVGSIDRIQKGQNTLRFELARKMSSRISSPRRGSSTECLHLDSAKCLSIIFGGERTLDLMVTDDDIDRDEVMRVLETLSKTYSNAKVAVGRDVLLLRYIWIDVDRDKSNSINASEFSNVLNRINFHMKKSDSDKMYNSFAKMIGLDRNDRRRGLSFEQCVTILHKIKRDSNWQIKPVRKIWFDRFGEFMNNGKPRTKVSAESFLKKFIWKKQGESNVTMEDVEALFRQLNRLEVADVASNLHLTEDDANAARYIDRDRFEAYLYSMENDIYDPKPKRFDPNSMDKPLSEYWINSSHNTYLTGGQFKSRSSVEMYMNALYGGCRCLEIDCFDGYRDSRTNDPIPLVYHGLTLTSQILFSDIIDTIKLFLNSNPDCFPLILSLENHCTLPFQEAMASYMISVFGENLYIPDEDSLHKSLPSPDELRGKVLLKGRRVTDTKEDYQHGSLYDTDSDDDSEIEEEHTKMERDDKPLSPKAPMHKAASNSAFSADLSRITIFHGVKFPNFDSGIKMMKDCMLSIDESKARKLCRFKDQQDRTDWVQFNHTHLSRVYPSGKRLDSSNFSPMTAWSRGCQLVALNIQTPDTSRRLNDGRFRQNGNCGYVLKPDILRLRDEPRPSPLTLSIKILCGTCLPKCKGDKRGECINPYVIISVHDIPIDGGKENVMVHTTPHVSKNGFNPIWHQEHPFRFKIENPDVAMLQFSVWDKDVAYADNFIASSSIPLSCVREGYRAVHLFDANNKRNGAFECASLLVEVKFKKKTEEIKMW